MRKVLFVPLFILAIAQIAAAQINIVPKPVEVSLVKGKYWLPKKLEVYAPNELRLEAELLVSHLSSNKAYKVSMSRQQGRHTNIRLLIQDSFVNAEGYTITVSKKGIDIKAANDKGIFYGIQTLLQILPSSIYDSLSNERWSIPCLSIADYPRFEYRGMMLDVSRQFFPIEYIERYIDWLARHKINTFHMHLTDDEGWRIEIKKYPILTEKGAWRGKHELLAPAHGSGNERYGGFYTQQQLKDLVDYAAKRKIEIVPEIEFPGHCKAVTECFPESYCNTEDSTLSATNYVRNVICPSKEANYEMIENILAEVVEIFPSKYIHIGGDEVRTVAWTKCPICQAKMKEQGFTDVHQLRAMFNRRIASMLKEKGRYAVGWEEMAATESMPDSTAIIAWQGVKPGVHAAQNGYKVVFAPAQKLYLDMKQSLMERGHGWCNITPLKHTYSFEPFADSTLTDIQKQNVLGVQGTLFAEYLNKPEFFVEYQTYPRLCAIAEIGWTPQEKRSFADFNNRLIDKHYNRMQHMGIHYRVAPPELAYTNGYITVVAEEGTIVRFAKYKKPTSADSIYAAPIKTDSPQDYIFKSYVCDTLSSAPMFLFPQAECTSWSPKTIKSAVFVDQRCDVSEAINGSGKWDAYFMYSAGYGNIRNVELYENGILIGSDNHTANIRIDFKDNSYSFEVKNYRPENKYEVRYQIKGTSTSGKLYMLRRDH